MGYGDCAANVGFSGGMELLFEGQRQMKIELPVQADDGGKEGATVQDLLLHVRDHIKPSRPELFMQNDSM